MKMFSRLLAGSLFFAGMYSPLLTQTANTALRGSVSDPSGAVVSGAIVNLQNLASGQQFTKKADARGEYVFSPIVPGEYRITVSAAGFADQSKQAEILVDQPATINFSLGVQASAITVDVSATAQTLNVTDATIGNSVGNQTIEALPMEGRNVPDLLSLQPGVLYLGRVINQSTDSRSGAVSGARSDQSNVTLDGLDDNDQTN